MEYLLLTLLLIVVVGQLLLTSRLMHLEKLIVGGVAVLVEKIEEQPLRIAGLQAVERERLN